MKTAFASLARSIPFTTMQRSVMIGSLLGDATLLGTTAGWCFRVHHGLAQRELVNWKYGMLSSHVRSLPRVSGPGIYFRTITHPELAELRNAFYADRTKQVPFALLERDLDALALAVWVMDDGARDGYQVRLNTQSFTVKEAEALASILRAKFGIEMRLNMDKGRPRLRSTASTTRTLVELVKEYTIPSMRYKLSL
jgi:hypothetical protein